VATTNEKNHMQEMNEIDVLLVEDNPYDAELTLRALKKQGLAHKSLTCTDGVEALDFLFGQGNYAGRNLAERPKVIFLDLKLPRISGLEVLERVKSDDRTRTIPVVVLSSSQEEQDITRSYDLGVNSYTVKPVEFEKFFQVVAELGLYWLTLNQVPK
jgi:two-component system, response regulator